MQIETTYDPTKEKKYTNSFKELNIHPKYIKIIETFLVLVQTSSIEKDVDRIFLFGDCAKQCTKAGSKVNVCICFRESTDTREIDRFESTVSDELGDTIVMEMFFPDKTNFNNPVILNQVLSTGLPIYSGNTTDETPISKRSPYFNTAKRDSKVAYMLYKNTEIENAIIVAHNACELFLKAIIIDYDLIDVVDDEFMKRFELNDLYNTIKKELHLKYDISVQDLSELDMMYLSYRYPEEDFVGFDANKVRKCFETLETIISLAKFLYDIE